MSAAAELATRLKELAPAGKRVLLAKLIELKKRKGKRAPLSYAQQRLWFLEQLVSGNPFYNDSNAARLLFPVDGNILEKSLNEIIRRHEALRTCFEAVDGEPVQRVLPSLQLTVPIIDLSHLPAAQREAQAVQYAGEHARTPFDLSRAPLMRVAMLRLGPSDHLVVLTMHHIVCDGWSMTVLLRELQALYGAFLQGLPSPLPELPIQYTDYSAWQRNWLSGPQLEKQVAFWKSCLADVPTLDLPTDYARPAIPTFTGGREALSISPTTYRALQALCGQEAVTPFMALLAAFQALLSRYSGQDDIAVGCPIANRNRPEIEKLIGFFVNTLVLRTNLAGNPTFREVLQRVREVALSAYAHQDLPFEKLVEELQPKRDPSRNPLFQVTFQLNPYAKADVDPEQLLEVIDVDLPTSKFDLRCDLLPDGDGLSGYLEYSADLFAAATVRAMARHFEALLAAIATSPDHRIADIRLLSATEERSVVEECNRTGVAFPWQGCAHERFAALAQSYPDRLAVSEGGRSVTYGELNHKADRLASELRTRGIRPGGLVAVVLNRSIELVVAVLAVLKTGAAYVPLDPSYPQERIAMAMREALVPIVMTSSRHEDRIPHFVPRLHVDTEVPVPPGDIPPVPGVRVDGESLAYVIFTSGSTGKPRGVEIMHKSLCNLVDWHQQAYGISAEDRATLYASPGFDASVWEMWPYLTAGASLHVPDAVMRSSPEALAQWMANERITISFLPTPIAESFIEGNLPALPTLRVLLTGGDKLRRPPSRPLPFRFVNHYGPTECTVVATCCDVPAGAADEVPTIGWPIANIRAYVLDRLGRPVPSGVKGELYLGGEGLARGYLNQAELTRERFIADRFAGRIGARLYRTGDLVRRRLDGSLEFYGRSDNQIKLRGYRVEPGDIEAALDQHPAIAKSLVVAQESAAGEKTLIAYLTRRDCDAPVQTCADGQDERVGAWRQIYEQLYGGEGRDRGFDIVGWNSSYTGAPLSAEEMREQVDGTVSRIAALGARRVLEIGCGTGLLLLRLAGDAERYVGTDFSAAVLTSLRAAVDERGLRQVELWEREADDFSSIEPGSFDVVVLNSVVQYFPSMDYLARVLTGALAVVGPGGFVFVGDVRSLPLLPLLHAGIEVARDGQGLSVGELRERMARRLRQEQELVIEPGFFAALAQCLADGAGVALQVKRGWRQNELTRFRYDVVLQRTARAPGTVVEQSWPALGSLEALRRKLTAKGRARALLVRGVPSARLTAQWDWLEHVSRADAAAAATPLDGVAAEGIEPEQLWALGGELGWDVQVGWAEGDPARCDVLCVRRGRDGAPHVWSLPAPAEMRPWSAYANTLARPATQQHMAEVLRQHLRTKLPDYMIPTSFVWLDALPLTPHGKLNRRALPAPNDKSANIIRLPPSNDIEATLTGIWQEVLGLDQVGVHDNFFDIGGQSLLLVRVHSRLTQLFQTAVTLVDLYRLPTVSALAKAIAAERNGGGSKSNSLEGDVVFAGLGS